jgi:hypothetical protein
MYTGGVFLKVRYVYIRMITATTNAIVKPIFHLASCAGVIVVKKFVILDVNSLTFGKERGMFVL